MKELTFVNIWTVNNGKAAATPDLKIVFAAKAEALYMQSVHRTADTAIRARSQVREAYSAYRTTYDVARVVSGRTPLRKTRSSASR